MSSARTVTTHDKDKNGNLAWIDLKSKMESQGNIGQIVADDRIELSDLKLNYDSFGSFERYQQKFKTILLRLSEAGEPLSDAMSKTYFITNITYGD
jgi:hypothetical protein